MSDLRKPLMVLPYPLAPGLYALHCWSHHDAENWQPSLADRQPEHTSHKPILYFFSFSKTPIKETEIQSKIKDTLIEIRLK